MRPNIVPALLTKVAVAAPVLPAIDPGSEPSVAAERLTGRG